MIETAIAPSTLRRKVAMPSPIMQSIRVAQITAGLRARRSARALELVEERDPVLQDRAQATGPPHARQRGVGAVAQPGVLPAEGPGDVLVGEPYPQHLEHAGVLGHGPRHLRRVADD